MKNRQMEQALFCAEEAYGRGDIPVGAIITQGEIVIAKQSNIGINHAEILAINQASDEKISGENAYKRLSECDIFVTLEPCLMCVGAIFNARIKNIYFGAYDFENGAFSKFEVEKKMKNPPNIYGGIMQFECEKILKDFFKGLRN
jgi:tRNA(adenine34) deaminase